MLFFALAAAMAPLVAEMPAAAAKRRVVLLDFSGPGGKKIEKVIAVHLRRKYILISQLAFVNTAKALKSHGQATSDDVANVARKLGADAIIAGKVQKARRKLMLVLTVRDGATGLEIDQIKVPLKGAKADKVALAKIDAQLFPVLAKAEGVGQGEAGGGAAAAPPPAGNPEAAAQAGETAASTPPSLPGEDTENPLDQRARRAAAPPPTPAQALTHDDPAAAALGGGSSHGAPAASTEAAVTAQGNGPGQRPNWRPYLMAALRLDGAIRNLSFDAAGPVMVQKYQGGPVLAVGVAVQAFPMAANPGMLRGLGLYANYDKVLTINSQLTRMPPAMNASISSSEQQIRLGLEYGYRLREAADAVTVGLRFGYGIAAFTMSPPSTVSTTELTVPDVDYHYVDAGAFVRAPFQAWNHWCEVGARLSYLPVLSGGSILSGGRDMMFLGAGSASGLEVELSALANVTQSIFVPLLVRWSHFSTTFANMPPSPSMATAASDSFYNFGLGVGIRY